MFGFFRLFKRPTPKPEPVTVNGYALRFKDGRLLPFTTGTPRGLINVLVRLGNMKPEDALGFFEELEIVEVTIATRKVEINL